MSSSRCRTLLPRCLRKRPISACRKSSTPGRELAVAMRGFPVGTAYAVWAVSGRCRPWSTQWRPGGAGGCSRNGIPADDHHWSRWARAGSLTPCTLVKQCGASIYGIRFILSARWNCRPLCPGYQSLCVAAISTIAWRVLVAFRKVSAIGSPTQRWCTDSGHSLERGSRQVCRPAVVVVLRHKPAGLNVLSVSILLRRVVHDGLVSAPCAHALVETVSVLAELPVTPSGTSVFDVRPLAFEVLGRGRLRAQRSGSRR